jgi:hypothetical protein
MPVVIKEIRIRTVVEKRIVTETEISEELIRKVGNRVRDRLDAEDSVRPATRRWQRKKNER